jgi:Phosphotransferase enzyme family
MEEALGRSLATGNTAEIFEWGSRVMKLYKSPAAKPAAFREAATSAAVEALGLPVPKVWDVHNVGGRWGLVFDRVTQKSFAEQMRGKMNDVPRYLECMVQLHIRIHSHKAIRFSELKVTLAANIAASLPLDKPRKQELLDAIVDLPDGDRLCHGDFHPLNILGDTFGPGDHRLAGRAPRRSGR